ncbi:carbonic anhydrase [Actinoplanes sp. NPDC051861]|uniref:carbonic anhydrase n=1 Tax=Actinoplanes sp. NPDC051861 TaxID=3155170 RepID=UPI003433DDD3
MDPGRLFTDATAAPIPSQRTPNHVGRPGPVEALTRLREGNARFALGSSHSSDGQPYAVIIGCIDARVPVEAVFGQTAGAICVARSAGHVLDRAVTGSVEFAVIELRVSLVVVLGHEDCRAVAAAYEANRTGRRAAGARQFLIDQITPAMPTIGSPDDSLDQATRSHVRRTVATLRRAEYLRESLTAHRIDVVGGIYRLASGRIEML